MPDSNKPQTRIRKRRAFATVLLAIIIAITAPFVIDWMIAQSLRSKAKAILPGMTRAEVHGLMGPPRLEGAHDYWSGPVHWWRNRFAVWLAIHDLPLVDVFNPGYMPVRITYETDGDITFVSSPDDIVESYKIDAPFPNFKGSWLQ